MREAKIFTPQLKERVLASVKRKKVKMRQWEEIVKYVEGQIGKQDSPG